MKHRKFPFHLYVEEYDFGNGGGLTCKLAKFRNRALAEAAGEALLELTTANEIKLYERYFVVEK